MFGSSVVPDFEDTKNSVFSKSSSSSSVLICCGSVESRTRSRGSPAVWEANVNERTSGQRLDPPIPSTTACLKPADRMSSWSAVKRCA